MDERLGRDTFAFLGRFPIQTCPTLHWPHKQRWMRVFRRFCEFQLCIRWGRVGKEGQLQENFEKEALFYEGTQKITEKYKYCFTVPRTFVHDCITLCFFKELLQENEENCGKHILVVSYREIVNYSPPPTPFPCTLHPIDTYLGCSKYNQTKASFSFQDRSKENHYYWADHFLNRLCSRCSISERSVKYRWHLSILPLVSVTMEIRSLWLWAPVEIHFYENRW